MSINNQNTQNWKKDIDQSVLFYNDWFMQFAPITYIASRKEAINCVLRTFGLTSNFSDLSSDLLLKYPSVLRTLRVSATPPLARDRLAGLASVSKSLVKNMEDDILPKKVKKAHLDRMLEVISNLLDREIMPWLCQKRPPELREREIASAIIGDRLCGSLSDPIIRNAQERRQFASLSRYLEKKGYVQEKTQDINDFRHMKPGTYAFHFNVKMNNSIGKSVSTPIDVVIQPYKKPVNGLPLLFECKSAGDYANPNKRRKEEKAKYDQLKDTYGNGVQFILFLCGYFDASYLGYEAAEGIDWVWEHRIEDMEKIGV